MKLKVQTFARARELAGQELIEVECPDHATVSQLREAMFAQHPQLKALDGLLHITIDLEFADDRMLVSADAEIACFPPVSGG